MGLTASRQAAKETGTAKFPVLCHAEVSPEVGEMFHSSTTWALLQVAGSLFQSMSRLQADRYFRFSTRSSKTTSWP